MSKLHNLSVNRTSSATDWTILNFHGVGRISREFEDGEANCWIERDVFENILELVHRHPQVQLTFDDGNVSDAEIVVPALLRHGLSATFFICSGRLDHPAFLSRSQVRELKNAGMKIGSHGIAHLPWRNLTARRLREEIEGSRRELESVCGSTVEDAACPYGSYDRRVLAALREAGYLRVYTSDGGRAAPSAWLQSRTTITRSMSLAEIRTVIVQGTSFIDQLLIDLRKVWKRARNSPGRG